MQTFDLAEVRAFTTNLDARMDECDNGEGMECANIDGTLRNYAVLCWEFCEKVREWGLAVFHAQASYDPEVDKLWYTEGISLFRRASDLWAWGQEMEGDCFVLENGAALGSTLWQLERLLTWWVAPKPAAAPLARHGIALSPEAKEAMQQRIDELPLLPADWQPSDPRQRSRYKKLRKRMV